ncbi:hypothetical protein FE257_012464 [Aspergillus nanangensis]|uniref:Uncharacterized protein n=1 Tax=Aspergillus nanangensis TaxID=2582783 RepID=A0AAD4GYW5_ASPNN|nr:hypothetical protein FE257_012464 [Aspergillus nanangensis]
MALGNFLNQQQQHCVSQHSYPELLLWLKAPMMTIYAFLCLQPYDSSVCSANIGH